MTSHWIQKSTTNSWKCSSLTVSRKRKKNLHHLIYFVISDNKFNLVEDRPASHITKKGRMVLMTNSDPRWCTDCYVYLIVNMLEDRRVYVTATARIGSLNL